MPVAELRKLLIYIQMVKRISSEGRLHQLLDFCLSVQPFCFCRFRSGFVDPIEFISNGGSDNILINHREKKVATKQSLGSCLYGRKQRDCIQI